MVEFPRQSLLKHNLPSYRVPRTDSKTKPASIHGAGTLYNVSTTPGEFARGLQRELYSPIKPAHPWK